MLDSKALERFQKYMELVLEWNNKINLTSITDIDEFIVKHFYDSLTLLTAVNIPINAKVIDVGTGAGFPGIPLKIVRPDIRLTLLDSLNKRLVFLNDHVLKNIELSADVVHGRAEEISKDRKFREKFDIATSRAVANLSALSEYCLPLVKVGGIFSPMKGLNIQEELGSSKNAVSLLGGELAKVTELKLPDGSKRNIVVIDKIKSTPEKYPRRGVKINKNPL
ncbi:MAG: 16S rRNA (guanine(527)-N(7))-methyltransferase RsmG [Lachnospiraceae bacterium]|nr:16S rRNA (guanine(527)-N(7))-methyltransferase RsmG [Lachnospiraceae bacterium]